MRKINPLGRSLLAPARLPSLRLLGLLAFVLSNQAGLADSSKMLAFSVAHPSNPFYASVIEGARAEAKKAGYELLVLDAQGKSSKQLADIEDALAKKVSGVLINGVDDSASQLAQLAGKQGVPAVAVQRKLSGEKPAPFVGTQNIELGRKLVGWYAAWSKNRPAKVVVLTGTPGAASSEDRIKGMKDELAKYPQISVLAWQTANYDRAKAMTVTENLLQRFSDVDAVLCLNDEMAMGASAAVKGLDRKIAITGMDANKDARIAVQRGELAMTIALPAESIGRTAVQVALAMQHGKPVAPETIMPVQFVTAP